MNKTLLGGCCLMIALSAPALAGDADAGKKKSQTCAACHGPDGNSSAPDFPKIAGQHYDYLMKALKDYKSGRAQEPDHGSSRREPDAARHRGPRRLFLEPEGARHQTLERQPLAPLSGFERTAGPPFNPRVHGYAVPVTLLQSRSASHAVLCLYSHKSRIRHLGQSGLRALQT